MHEKLHWKYIENLVKTTIKQSELWNSTPDRLTIKQFCDRLRALMEYNREQDAIHLGIDKDGNLPEEVV